jgi:hypothetical protein
MNRLTENGHVFTTEQIFRNIDRWSISQCLNKLSEYEDLEEQGRLIKLPCKIGTKVYDMYGGESIKEREIIMCQITAKRIDMIIQLSAMAKENMTYRMGETAFYTREEAEAKMKEVRESD